MQLQSIKNISFLTKIRFEAAVLLIFLTIGLYSDIELNFSYFIMLLPFCYIFTPKIYATVSITILIIPLLLNIALWIPNSTGYLFIRVALMVERIKLYLLTALFVIMSPMIIFSQNSDFYAFNLFLLMIFVPLSFYYNKKIDEVLQTEILKSCFKIIHETEERIKHLLKRNSLLFVLLIVLIMAVDMNLRLYQPSDTSIEKKEIIHKVLKYESSTFTRGKEIEYRTKPKSSVAHDTQLSNNEKMMLIRISSSDDGRKNLFIFDTNDMHTITILQTPVVAKGNITGSGYTFTKDDKYIIVGDDIAVGNPVKFQVLDILTGSHDNRFSDPQRMLESLPASVGKGVAAINFNPAGNYFAVILRYSEIIEIWDYVKGQPAIVKQWPNSIQAFTWLTDNKFLVAYYKDYEQRIGEIHQYEILSDGSVTTRVLANIAKSMTTKYDYAWRLKSSPKGKYIATISIEKSSGVNLNSVEIWDTDKDQLLTSISRSSRVKDVEFNQDGSKIMVLEELRDLSCRLSIWNTQTGKKERDLVTPSLSQDDNTEKVYKMKLIDNDKKVMIIGEALYVITL